MKCIVLCCYTCIRQDSALVHCSRKDSALVHCSGDNSALVHIKWRGQCSSADVAKSIGPQCTCSGEDSTPLQMKWIADTPMFFELKELVKGKALCSAATHVVEKTVLQCTCSREDSAPLKMEWKADIPIFYVEGAHGGNSDQLLHM